MYLVSCTSKQSPGGFPATRPRALSSPPSQEFFISLIALLTRASQPQELFWQGSREGNFLFEMKDSAGICLPSLAAGLPAASGQQQQCNPVPHNTALVCTATAGDVPPPWQAQ